MTNNVGGGPAGWEDAHASFAAFDALPSAVRRALAAAALNISPVAMLELWRRYLDRLGPAGAETHLLRCIEATEVHDQRAFSDAYVRQHGRALPAVAAGATVLRTLDRGGQWMPPAKRTLARRAVSRYPSTAARTAG